MQTSCFIQLVYLAHHIVLLGHSCLHLLLCKHQKLIVQFLIMRKATVCTNYGLVTQWSTEVKERFNQAST